MNRLSWRTSVTVCLQVHQGLVDGLLRLDRLRVRLIVALRGDQVHELAGQVRRSTFPPRRLAAGRGWSCPARRSAARPTPQSASRCCRPGSAGRSGCEVSECDLAERLGLAVRVVARQRAVGADREVCSSPVAAPSCVPYARPSSRRTGSCRPVFSVSDCWVAGVVGAAFGIEVNDDAWCAEVGSVAR